ncbi:MAG: DUF3307 domain-containing protein [Thermodesulfobacteriota bacterium]
MIFWKVLLAHVLTDFVLQPDHLAENKGKITVLLIHSLIFFLIATLVLLPSFSYQTIIGLVFLALFHGFVDYFKNLIQERAGKNHWGYFLGDQVIHVAGIGGIVFFLDRDHYDAWVDVLSASWSTPSVFLFISLFVLIVFGGGFFTGILCKGFLRGLNSEKRPGIEMAGRYIGIIERSLVLTAVLFGKMEFIGYIFAAKSIARYPEMKEGSHFAEYYLIGTLTSIAIAFFGGLFLKYLLGW